jgi:hypothetical protein
MLVLWCSHVRDEVTLVVNGYGMAKRDGITYKYGDAIDKPDNDMIDQAFATYQLE